ncbi:hypothetical protein T4A_4243 [Trichinella pseudospiralis]|uniref:Uncharacterized protein n=1 Tax=Trichinella pseudospiralis TaxID=6337 RepID=A0A0V1END9_TRIPS|nr:hypothetical protein T4A_4243 [Trichinella pseudospiralis]
MKTAILKLSHSHCLSEEQCFAFCGKLTNSSVFIWFGSSAVIIERQWYAIKSRENFCLPNVLKSSHSRTCLPENVCKFLFHCYAYSYMVLVLMIVGVRCAVLVHWHFPINDGQRTPLNMAKHKNRRWRRTMERRRANVLLVGKKSFSLDSFSLHSYGVIALVQWPKFFIYFQI